MTRRDFLRDYLDDVRENLHELESSLLAIEREGTKEEEISQIFRAAHSIKGASAYMGFEKLAHLTHEMESLISDIQTHSRPVPSRGISLMLECVDFISRALGQIEASREELPLPSELLDRLREALALQRELAARSDLADALDTGPEGPSQTIHATSGTGLQPEESHLLEAFSSLVPMGDETGEEIERMDDFLDSFRSGYWELVSLLTFSPQAQVLSSDIHNARKLIESLAKLSSDIGKNRIAGVLGKCEEALAVSFQSGRRDGQHYASLLNSYGRQCMEILPTLELPFVGFEAEEHTSADEEEDEEDPELMAIFVSSFKERFAELLDISSTEPLSALIPTEAARAAESVHKLISSARYMGYEELIGVLEELAEALNELDAAEPTEGESYKRLLIEFGERLEEALPPLKPLIGSAPPSEVGEPEEEIPEEDDEELLGIFLDSLEENYRSLLALAASVTEALPDPGEIERIRELVRRMTTSARYMGYDRVVSVLEAFEESLMGFHHSGALDRELCLRLVEDCGDSLGRILPGFPGSQPGAAPAELADSAKELTGVGEEEDEEDEELLEIFIDALRESLAELTRLAPAEEWDTLSPSGCEQAVEILTRSVASARYMDYSHIESALGGLVEKLRQAQNTDGVTGGIFHEILTRYRGCLQSLSGWPAVELGPEGLGPPMREGLPEEAERIEDGSPEKTPAICVSPALGSAKGFEAVEHVDHDRLMPRGDGRPMGERGFQAEKRDGSESREPGRAERGKTVETLRVSVAKVDQLMNQVIELVVRRSEIEETTTSFMRTIKELGALGKLSREELRKLRSIGMRYNECTLSLGRVTGDLQGSVMRARMLPISQLFRRFPRIVRDQALKLGKRVDLTFEGGQTEIDKRILEQMYDPLVQFLRNAIVHGVESPEERLEAGKPETGSIRLLAYQEGDFVTIEVEDDGRGIDAEKLGKILKDRGTAISYGLEQLTYEQLIQAVFLPGVSTHQSVDGAAGRGVGLDVVKAHVERMNGAIVVESEPLVGTRFTVRIPLTVAIIRALLVKAAGQTFSLPLNCVSHIFRYRREETHTIEGFEVIQQQGRTIPLVRLNWLLGFQERAIGNGRAFIVVVTTTFRDVGIVVDDLVGKREIVIKPIENEEYSIEGFSGATILGDGAISLILDVSALLKTMKEKDEGGRMKAEG